MKEGWTSLPLAMRQELLPMDWNGIIGRWNPHKRRRLGFDHKRLWEMIDQNSRS